MLNDTDTLRLNVLLTQNPRAIKINESSMVLSALTAKGEAKIQLNGGLRSDAYLKEIRELLSTVVLGSPGGYPIFLKRWTRMGQTRSDSLANLLLLGEEEAVVAVVNASVLSTEIAQDAWWIMPDADNARTMMQKQHIAESVFGQELCDFLLEFLPFEQEQQAMIDSVTYAMRSGHLTEAQVNQLWKIAKRKTAYYVGFLNADTQALPIEKSIHPLYHQVAQLNADECGLGNEQLQAMLSVLGEQGQGFLKVTKLAIAKPNNQDVVVSLLNAMGQYFSYWNAENRAYTDLSMWNRDALHLSQQQYPQAFANCPQEIVDLVVSMMALSMVNEVMVNPIFGVSDAIGSVMRKKVKPVFDEILEHINCLCV